MNYKIPAALMTLLATVPAGSAMAANGHLNAHATKAKPKTQKFTGPEADMRWGPVLVTISVKNKKIIDSKGSVSPDTRRSQFLDNMSLPILRQEVLKAQSANIDEVSGATMTSDAYVQSLRGAIKKAKQKKALK